MPVLTAAIPAGLDPVSVRWRTAGEFWVTNRTSDSVSVIAASKCVVRQTLQTADEPSDTSPIDARGDQRVLLSANGLALLFFGILPQKLMGLCVVALAASGFL
jgi:NADH-quinone oxidoreductase subunit N